jgi:S-methylmethionine-dependent homocysteine/selenocysteine methylase
MDQVIKGDVMPRFRQQLPQLGGDPFLTDGGIETTLIFREGLTLPDFAAFDLLKEPAGVEVLRHYYRTHAAIAAAHGVGFILEAATWRASPEWAARLGYSAERLVEANRRAIEMLVDIREEFAEDRIPMVISGCVGPRADGYVPSARMSASEAQAFHAVQIGAFAGTEADLVTAITMNYAEEAVGIARAAQAAAMPVVISFTVETDGRLPTGDSLEAAVQAVDDATGAVPAYYMINCAHPTHFDGLLGGDQPWERRIRGVRANASRRSHVELNDAPELDAGDPEELGAQYAELRRRLPSLNVLGGCCGTDHRHIEAIATAVVPTFARSEASP